MGSVDTKTAYFQDKWLVCRNSVLVEGHLGSSDTRTEYFHDKQLVVCRKSVLIIVRSRIVGHLNHTAC